MPIYKHIIFGILLCIILKIEKKVSILFVISNLIPDIYRNLFCGHSIVGIFFYGLLTSYIVIKMDSNFKFKNSYFIVIAGSIFHLAFDFWFNSKMYLMVIGNIKIEYRQIFFLNIMNHHDIMSFILSTCFIIIPLHLLIISNVEFIKNQDKLIIVLNKTQKVKNFLRLKKSRKLS